jgi:hypothetical protein
LSLLQKIKNWIQNNTCMKKSLIAITMATMLLAVSCRKEPTRQLTDAESRIYITNKATGTNFGKFATFAVRDSVLNVDGDIRNYQLNNVDRAFIEAVRSNMRGRGYTEVTAAQSPDLGILVTRITNTSTGSIIWGGGWGGGGWWGWGPPVWGVATFEVREGMLSVDMGDVNKAPIQNQINLIWSGLIRGRGIFEINNAQPQINQLFEQSPYIKKG